MNGNFINHNGDSAILTSSSEESSGRWLIYAADPATSSPGNLFDYSKHYDQPFMEGAVPKYAGSGNWFFYSIAPVLSVRPSNKTMTYGDDRPDFTPVFSGFIDGDAQKSAGITGTATWDTNGSFSSAGHLIQGFHDVNYAGGLVSHLGYQFADDASSSGELTVNARSITVESFTANDKVYDGNTVATISNSALFGLIAGDSVSLTGTGTFDDKHVGTDKLVMLTNVSLTGPDRLNYILNPGDSAIATADITPRRLAVTGFNAENKVYDGTTAAQLISGSGALEGAVAGDTVFISGGVATFNDKHAGQSKPVIVSNVRLTGADSGNYMLGRIAATTADITPKSLTVGNLTAENKIYDGNTSATISNSALVGLIAGDSVSLTSIIGAFDDKHVGTDKPVTLISAALTGPDRLNYILNPSDSATATADITPRDITVGSLFADSKTYDGTVDTDISGMLVGTIAGDSVSLTGTGAFDDKHAGTGKTVTLISNVLTGADRDNYRLNDTGIGNMAVVADIFPRVLTVSNFSAKDKVYDGHTLTRVNGTLLGTVTNDSIVLSGTGHFEDANAGVNKIVTVGDVSLSGADSANYLLDDTGTATTVTMANITPAMLTYFADQTTRLAGAPTTGLSGTVTGFIGEDTQTNATTGTPVWTTPAANTSPPGVYPVYGSGLSAVNYVFDQAPNNDHALVLQMFDSNDRAFRQETIDTSIQNVNTAISGTNAILDATVSDSKVISMMSSAMPYATIGFGRLSLTNMSRKNMRWLMNYRRAFKEKLLADAIYQLELNPGLADVPLCSNLAEINSGSCRISYDQHKAPQSSSIKAQQPDQPPEQKGRQKAKIASIPQIERKFAVLFGVDRYMDNTIPFLENAIADTKAIGRLFADKLGYEVHVVNNATRADIVRTLNQLAVAMEPDDSLVVYYAGHGYLNEKTGGGYWIPSDASAKDPTSWISNVSISEMLSGIRSKQMVMISDSCYSGTFTKEQKIGSGNEVIDPADILAKRSVVVMSSGGDEPVADEGRNGHSIFAWHLMQALYDVDHWQAGYNVFEQVQHEVKRSFPQTPQYGAVTSAGHEEGDYLFEFRQLESVQ